LAHDERGGGTVADLAGVAGGDDAVRLEGRLQVGERLDGGAGADALVLQDQLVALDDVAGLLVEPLLGDAADLVLEAALVGGRLGELLRAGAEGVEVLTGEPPLLGDHLGRDALRHEVRVAGGDLRAERERARGDRGAHRGGGHHLDAGGDHDVVGAGDDALGGEVGGLLRRAALAVHGGGRHGLGEAGGEDGVAADVEALVADLHDTAHDHVLDEGRIEVVALDERLQDLPGQVGGVPAGELSVALAAGGADGVDDDGGGHGRVSWGCLPGPTGTRHLTGWSSVPRMSLVRKPGGPVATRGLEAVTGIAAALSRAAASALDPASVLARTTAVLAAELPLAETHLWRAGPDGPTLLASHRVPGSPDPAAAGAPPGAPTAATPFAYPVESRGQLLGHLVVEPATGAALDGDDAALLALAASLVGGALERLDLFREVMALERMKSDFLARVSHEL